MPKGASPRFSWKVRIATLFGRFSLTPFENDLLQQLRKALDPTSAQALDDQLSRFNSVVRLIDPDPDPTTYGYTEFHRTRFGRPILTFEKPFGRGPRSQVLAQGVSKFTEGEIQFQFWIVYDRLFSIHYRSPQGIFYPPSTYSINSLIIASKEDSVAS